MSMKNMSPSKSPTKSPVKSPVKKAQKENIENISPIKCQQSFESPVKGHTTFKLEQVGNSNETDQMNSQKENRKSQQRKQRERTLEIEKVDSDSDQEKNESADKKDRLDSMYLEVDCDTDKNSSNSPLKPCPKSPLKRMKNLDMV